MAKKRRNVHTRMHVVNEEYTGHAFFDERGEALLRLGETLQEGERANGAEITETVTDHIETSAGDVLSASSLAPGPQQIPLAICTMCKKQARPSRFHRGHPQIALAPAAGMKRCCRCRANLCEKHFRISDFDHRPRCDRCYRWHWFYKIVVEPVLFVE